MPLCSPVRRLNGNYSSAARHRVGEWIKTFMERIQDFRNSYSQTRNSANSIVTLAKSLSNLPKDNPQVNSLLGILKNLLNQRDVLTTIQKLAQVKEPGAADKYQEIEKLLRPVP